MVKDDGTTCPSGICIYFEHIPIAAGYNIYEGTLPGFYDHGASPFLCNAPTQPGPAGALRALITPSAGDHYYLVTAWNGDPVDGQEGPSGCDSAGRPSPPDENTCDPVNNH